jgi:hypothetical protein
LTKSWRRLGNKGERDTKRVHGCGKEREFKRFTVCGAEEKKMKEKEKE